MDPANPYFSFSRQKNTKSLTRSALTRYSSSRHLATMQIPHSPRVKFMVAILLGLLMLLSPHQSRAGSATWQLSPMSGDWNHASNWTPATVPNGPTDTATFASSSVTSIKLSADTEVGSIVFNSGASAYTITQGEQSDPFTLTISGTGIVNSSGVTQTLLSVEDDFGGFGIQFINSASAGVSTKLIVAEGAQILFLGASSADGALITNNGGDVRFNPAGGLLSFEGMSSAGSSTITTQGGLFQSAGGGMTLLTESATADHATFITGGGTAPDATGGILCLQGNATAPAANFTTEGGAVAGAGGGMTSFTFSSSAANGTFTTNGGAVGGASGGVLQFGYTSSPGNAILI